MSNNQPTVKTQLTEDIEAIEYLLNQSIRLLPNMQSANSIHLAWERIKKKLNNG